MYNFQMCPKIELTVFTTPFHSTDSFSLFLSSKRILILGCTFFHLGFNAELVVYILLLPFKLHCFSIFALLDICITSVTRL